MWDKHCRAERAVHEARLATKKANKLLTQANLSVPRPSHIHVGDPSDGYNSEASSTVLCGHGLHVGSSSGSEVGSDAGSRTGSHAGSDATAASSERDDQSVHGAFQPDDTTDGPTAGTPDRS